MAEDPNVNPETQSSSLKTGASSEPKVAINSHDKNDFVPRIVYILYLLSLIIGYTSLIGVVVAYIFRNDSNETWVKAHYRFQIRTFWIGLLYCIISIVLLIVLVGYFLLFLTYIWLIIRSVRGWKDFENRKAPSDLTTWLY